MAALRSRAGRVAGLPARRHGRMCSAGARAAPRSSPGSERCSRMTHGSMSGWRARRGGAGGAPRAAGAARRQPLRVVLDSQLRTPPGARLLSPPGEVLIFTTLTAPEDPRALSLSTRGARLESLPLDAERIALPSVLDRLGELELNEVLVEAGAILAGE